MSQLVTYKGRPVKKHSRNADGMVKLIFVAETPGQAGEQLTVSQDEWAKFSSKKHFAKGKAPDKRAVARRNK
jgi:hypothetical protein